MRPAWIKKIATDSNLQIQLETRSVFYMLKHDKTYPDQLQVHSVARYKNNLLSNSL